MRVRGFFLSHWEEVWVEAEGGAGGRTQKGGCKGRSRIPPTRFLNPCCISDAVPDPGDTAVTKTARR